LPLMPMGAPLLSLVSAPLMGTAGDEFWMNR
jgi:hypothetical protein